MRGKTLHDLVLGRKKVGHKKGKDRKITLDRVAASLSSKAVYFSGTAYGNALYKVTLAFYGIGFSDTRIKGYSIKIKFKGKSDKYCTKPISSINKVQCRCGCPDFKFTYYEWNLNERAFIGKKFPRYVRKTTRTALRNPYRVPGLCKHLVRLCQLLKIKRILIDPTNDFGSAYSITEGT